MLCLSLAVALAAIPARAQDRQPPVDGGKAALAENFAHLAQLGVASRAITPETLRQSIALLKAATKLNPDEPRFARLLAEAALQAGDFDTAIEAFKSLVRLSKGNDRVAQMRLIDLYSARMETADARLEYLRPIIETDRMAAEVRSHAAHLAAQILLERAQNTKGRERLEESLRLNPLNPQALKLKYELFGPGAPTEDRVDLLLDLLRSNPSQPGVMAELAGELAEAGLHEQALQWYTAAFNLSQAVSRPILPQDMIDYSAQLIVTDQTSFADQVIANLLENDPTNVDAALLRLLVARRSGDAEKLTAAAEGAESALLFRASQIHSELTGDEPPATQPEGLPENIEVNVAEDVKLLQEAGNPRLTMAYSAVLADLAWTRVYFNEKPAEAEQILGFLRQLLPPDSIAVARLEGWTYLVSGRPDEAKVKLSAIADRDPLARLGMIRLMQAENPDRATEEARQLMADAGHGVMGAIVHDALRDQRPKLLPGEQPALTSVGQSVKALLDAFPQDWLDFMSSPNRFYLLRMEPLKVTHHYGDPIIARVTLMNLGPYDITVGPEGAVRPDVWFDVQVRGIMQGVVPGVAFDRLGGRVLLKPQERIVQEVRVDHGQLTQIMRANAAVTMPIYFSAFNNAITVPSGIIPGPGGQRVPSTRVINRIGVPVRGDAGRKALSEAMDRLNNATPEQRMRAAELVLWFAEQFARQEDEELKGRAVQLLSALGRAADDPDPQVRAWSGYLLARSTGDEARPKVIEHMLSDPAWESRLLSLLVVQSLDPQQWKEIAGPVAEGDESPIVKQFAQAVVEFADNPAATQPAEQPPAEGEAGSEPVAQP